MIKSNKIKIFVCMMLSLLMTLCIGCTPGTAGQKQPVTSAEMTIAGLRLGMTMDEVQNLFGEPVSTEAIAMDGTHGAVIWEYDGLTLSFPRYMPVVPEVQIQPLASITIQSDAYALENGLRIGSGYDRVLNTYAKDSSRGEQSSDFTAELLMTGTQTSEEIADTVTYIYRDLADEDQTGLGTAFEYSSENGAVVNYCWDPSDSDKYPVLSYTFDQNGTVTEISISDASRNYISIGGIVMPDDLALDDIKLGFTMDEVRYLLGEPTKIVDSDDLEENTFIYGHYYDWYYGEDLILTFYQFNGILTAPFQLGSVVSLSDSYHLLSFLRVGDTFSEVIQAYGRDEHFGEDALGGDGDSFGYYLYGGSMVGSHDEFPLTKAVGTAYTDNDFDDGNGKIAYHWYPAGSYGFENSYGLVIYMDADMTVSSIRIYYNSMMDAEQAVEGPGTPSDGTEPIVEYPDWSTWTRPIERHDLISYDELLAKMPTITSNADASRFTAEDAVAAGVRDGDTFNSIKKKLGDPIAIYDDRGVEGLMRYYLYDGVYFAFFKEISEDGGETYETYENGSIVMSAVIFGEGIEGPRGIKIGDTFQSVMSMYPQDRDYLGSGALFYGKYAFSGPSGKVYVSDITGFNDPFGESEGPGCPEIVLIPDGTLPFVKLFFDDNLILREIRVYYEVYPFG
ncbi:MAG TPA: hypothetical protein PK629_03560 [Oscillospiraceae bacterium]|nr:hypothetical protein [Oscillospiraceae bacterium]HPF56648.1 hypothetical protein [Clostridiales bacterium]HPK35660.1 hypothetical protein [Oscillospiraceae bacterium]HPR75802.1 hypothetical protein [Oscillospiraceae bacterium]